MQDLIPINTPVEHITPGRTGVIMGHNNKQDWFYPPSKYPYVIRWDKDGYEDVYAPTDFKVLA